MLRVRNTWVAAALTLVSAVALAEVASAEDAFLERPDASVRVLDPAHVLSSDDVAKLIETSERIELTLGVRPLVLTVEQLPPGADAAATARKTLESWKSPAQHSVLVQFSKSPRKVVVAMSDALAHYLGAARASLDAELASPAAESGSPASEIEAAMLGLAKRLAPPPSFAPPSRPANARIVDATAFIGSSTVAVIDSTARWLAEHHDTQLVVASFLGGSYSNTSFADEELVHGPRPGTSPAHVAGAAFESWGLGPRAILVAVVFQDRMTRTPVGEVAVVAGREHREFDARTARAIASVAGVVPWSWANEPSESVETALGSALGSIVARFEGSFGPGLLPSRAPGEAVVDPGSSIGDPDAIRSACRELADRHSVDVVVTSLANPWQESVEERLAAAFARWSLGPRGVVILEDGADRVHVHAGPEVRPPLGVPFHEEVGRRIVAARRDSREPLLEVVRLLGEHLDGRFVPPPQPAPAPVAAPSPRSALGDWATFIAIGMLPVGFFGTILAVVMLLVRMGTRCSTCHLPANTEPPSGADGPADAYACFTCGKSLDDYLGVAMNRGLRVVGVLLYPGYMAFAVYATRQPGSTIEAFHSTALASVFVGVPLALMLALVGLGWRYERFPCPKCGARLPRPREVTTRPPGTDGLGTGVLEFKCSSCSNEFAFPCRVVNPVASAKAQSKKTH